MGDQKIFLITGINSGLGKAFAEGALSAGHTVIGTARHPDAAADFEALAPGRAHAVVLDVTDFDAIPGAVAEAEAEVGPIDVLVNNAGYGQEGVVEESSLDELRRQFDTNVYGVGGDDQGGAAGHAPAPFRPHRQCHLDGRLHHLPGHCLLPRQQVCAGGHLGIARQGGEAVRRACHRAGAGRLPHRLGRPLHGALAARHRRL